ncbi:geranyl transferase [Pseudoxanthomonas gei]|uniref:Geranyl transferase n=1 Tax=Pseudoxanthomonas gei TaxID=1383030 RepID=A0ABX0AE11_9GAMM|nr:geranyl transferase [Pseudoxanthomonas gei]
MDNDAPFLRWAQRVETAMGHALPSASVHPQSLHAAMRHAVLGGGKRIRPLLVYATGSVFGTDERWLDAPAAAVELIHAYSLVHDDLPSMDNDEVRRGRPTVHVAFDEATAILAGDALQSLAFEVLAEAPVASELRVAWLRSLSVAAGAAGMCGGQALDVDATGKAQGLADLERMHRLKTGALIRASVRMGALGGCIDEGTLQLLDKFADALGLAFQVRDDILDVESTSRQLGKTAGKDAAQEKSTYPALLGMDGAKAKLVELDMAMHEALAPFRDHATALWALGKLAIHRTH